MENFSERLKYARHRASMSQDELARKTGVAKATISKAEMNLTESFRASTLFDVADALEIDPRWLATGKTFGIESKVGIPSNTGLLDAWGKLPTEVREPLLTLIEAHAKAHEQRYWMWIEDKPK